MKYDSNLINIIIVEDNRDLNDSIRYYLNSLKGFNVIGTAYNGMDGLKLIKSYKCDIVLLDIILPGIDGINILESLRDLKGIDRPSFIMFTAVSAETMTKRALDLGADYFILKPFDLALLSKRIIQVYEQRDSDKIDYLSYGFDSSNKEKVETPLVFTSNLLRKAGIPPNLKGCIYLKRAILAAIDNPDILNGMTKELYPLIAAEYVTTKSCVERAIRNAIEKAWKNNADNKKIFMPEVFGYDGAKPTNGAFITYAVNLYSERIKK